MMRSHPSSMRSGPPSMACSFVGDTVCVNVMRCIKVRSLPTACENVGKRSGCSHHDLNR